MSIAELKANDRKRRRKPAPTADAMQAALNDPRPKVRLPGDDRLLSDVGDELGRHLADKGLYVRNGELVLLDGGELRPVSPQSFRTLVEKHVICYRQRSYNDQSYQVGVTMRDDDARGVLASPQFLSHLRHIRRLNSCRLPVSRADGQIELLPVGYDAPTQTLTLPGVEYQTDLTRADAIEVINDLFNEFCFADGDRSKAVAAAALVGQYAAQLLPDGALRPAFIVTKNAEGAGATTLVMACVVPVLGAFPAGVKSDDDGETRKALTSAVREARSVIMLDNQKSRLSSAALEAFISSPQWSDRMLGENSTFTGPNIATVFATANGCKVSPDMRRRSLFMELHLAEERAEDRQFRRPMDLPALLAMRPKILAACWSLVRHWQEQGKPASTRSGYSSFPTWANIIGGIVEAAGFGCPLATANVAVAADEDGDDMRRLVAAMEPNKSYKSGDVIDLAKELELFEDVLDFDKDGKLKPKARSTFGHILGRYDRRLVSQYRVIIEGKGHSRRYRIESLNPEQQGDKVEQGVPVELGKHTHTRERPGTLVRPCNLAVEHPVEKQEVFSEKL